MNNRNGSPFISYIPTTGERGWVTALNDSNPQQELDFGENEETESEVYEVLKAFTDHVADYVYSEADPYVMACRDVLPKVREMEHSTEELANELRNYKSALSDTLDELGRATARVKELERDTTIINHLKAEWQADAIENLHKELSGYIVCQDMLDCALSLAAQYRQQAKGGSHE